MSAGGCSHGLELRFEPETTKLISDIVSDILVRCSSDRMWLLGDPVDVFECLVDGEARPVLLLSDAGGDQRCNTDNTGRNNGYPVHRRHGSLRLRRPRWPPQRHHDPSSEDDEPDAERDDEHGPRLSNQAPIPQRITSPPAMRLPVAMNRVAHGAQLVSLDST